MNESHLLGLLCAAFFSFITVSANAASISFGVPQFVGSCSEVGSRSDCSHNISVGPVPLLSRPSGITVRGQASANSRVGTASGDARVYYDIPYSLTRTVTVTPAPGGAIASFENFSLAIDVAYLGGVGSAPDNLQIGGAQGATAFPVNVSSAGGLFSTITLPGGAVSGSNNLFIPFGEQAPLTGLTPGLNASGPRQSEANTDAQGIPTDFRAWDDFLGPQVQDYSQPFNVTQTLDDVLQVRFRLFAKSQPLGFLSVQGGQAIACAGLGSSFGGVLLDTVDDTGCGTGGLFVGMEVGSSGGSPYQTLVGAVPIPAGVWLFGSGLLGLVGIARRKKAA